MKRPFAAVGFEAATWAGRSLFAGLVLLASGCDLFGGPVPDPTPTGGAAFVGKWNGLVRYTYHYAMDPGSSHPDMSSDTTGVPFELDVSAEAGDQLAVVMVGSLVGSNPPLPTDCQPLFVGWSGTTATLPRAQGCVYLAEPHVDVTVTTLTFTVLSPSTLSVETSFNQKMPAGVIYYRFSGTLTQTSASSPSPFDAGGALVWADAGADAGAVSRTDAGAVAGTDAGGLIAGGGPSCAGGTNCSGDSCCATIAVPAMTYLMGRSDAGTDACPPLGSCDHSDQPEHAVSVSGFSLDKYEVTVGRFRRFVDQYDALPRPGVGDGSHPRIPGSGWQADWSANLPTSATSLRVSLNYCSGTSRGTGDRSWTDAPSGRENAPITCVDWYLAFMFCLWDGGRLPTEAEWEAAASGGVENRLYPWGSAPPDGRVTSFLVPGFPEGIPWAPVGSSPSGNGRWGHADLAGSVAEWVFDHADDWWYSGTGATCTNCANVNGLLSARSLRGGGWGSLPANVRVTLRMHGDPVDMFNDMGVRCAR